MPEVDFTIRWPDGSARRCFSPSRTIEQAVVAGGRYPVAELVRRTSDALEAGSERVRRLHGFGCSAAVQEIATLRATAGRFDPAAIATVERVRPTRPGQRFPAPDRLGGERDVVIVGGGQAGLAASFALAGHGVEHVVLERDRIACSWYDQRWDSFCLVTPNWQCRLPGHDYDGDDPDGFMVKDELLDWLDRYVDAHPPPIHEGVAVESVERDGERFAVRTDRGTITARQVVLAVGGYHVPRIPALGARLADHVTQLHSSGYRNPASVPDGGVLVVGSGQSGAQIAEDLHLAGRDVHLAVGSAPRVARFYRGRDCVAWLHDIGHYRMPITEHPQGLGARREANHYVTGRDGGRDIDLRRFAAEGMTLHGRLTGTGDGLLTFTGDLIDNLDAADATAQRIKEGIDRYICETGIEAPQEAPYDPVWAPQTDGSAPLDLEREDVRTVVWATGFVSDWSWVRLPLFDGTGYPEHRRGVTAVPGVSVLGLPWLHTWGSGRFAGIAEDAQFVADHIAMALADERAPVRRAA